MKSILIADIKHERLHQFIVRITKSFLQDQRSNNYIYRRIRTGSFIAI